MTVGETTPPASICVGCGLCCDGTLHPHTIMEAGDEDSVRTLGLVPVERDGRPCFAQPCAKFSGVICTIYDRRPRACRRYRCKLLKKVEEGAVNVAEARKRIETTKSLIARVCSDSPESLTAEGRAALGKRLKENALQSLDGNARQRAARTLLAVSAIDYVLERWFLFSKPENVTATGVNDG